MFNNKHIFIDYNCLKLHSIVKRGKNTGKNICALKNCHKITRWNQTFYTNYITFDSNLFKKKKN